jgi:transposase
MSHVIIGVDPHKLSATTEAVDDHERKLGEGRFPTDTAGDAAMVRYVKSWPERTWAVEGANGPRPGVATACCGRFPTPGRP